MLIAALFPVVLLILLGLALVLTLPAIAAGRLARVHVSATELVVTPVGLMKLWALRRRLAFPAGHVVGVSTSQDARTQRPVSLRLLGTGVPGLIMAGTMLNRGGGKSFWIYGKGRSAITIDLRGEGFRYLCVEVEDPAGTCRRIRERLPGTRDV